MKSPVYVCCAVDPQGIIVRVSGTGFTSLKEAQDWFGVLPHPWECENDTWVCQTGGQRRPGVFAVNVVQSADPEPSPQHASRPGLRRRRPKDIMG